MTHTPAGNHYFHHHHDHCCYYCYYHHQTTIYIIVIIIMIIRLPYMTALWQSLGHRFWLVKFANLQLHGLL